MAYKKEINPWLKENGYTWADIDKFWEECCEVNGTCRLLKQAGRTWSDLHISQIKKLPTLKEETLKQLAANAEAERLRDEEAKKAKAEEEYYNEHFEELMVAKIDKGEPLTEQELERITEFSIKKEYGEKLRWTTPVYDVLSMCGRYFALTWYEANTESQENEFTCQPYEVYKHHRVVVEECFTKNKTEEIGEYIVLHEARELVEICSTHRLIKKDGLEVLVMSKGY